MKLSFGGKKAKHPKPSEKTVQSGKDPVGNSPMTAFEKARHEWFERMGSPVVERARYFILAMTFGVAFIAVVITLMRMMPLTRVEPYIVHVDKITGQAVAVRAGAEKYTPGAQEKQYFLVKWTRGLMALDPNTTESSLLEVFDSCRGKAIEEFTDFVNKTKPIVRVKTEQGLTRTVEIKSYSPLNEQSALIRFNTEERGLNKPTIRRSYVVTLHYAIDPPTTEAQIMRNPLGLFITHFAINEDLT